MSINKSKLLKSLVYDGAKRKNLEITDAVLDRISYELSVIENKNIFDYFILYSRIIEVCNELQLLRSSGRGSAASSLVNYCLDITKINPLEHNLIFERFINYRNEQQPDIGIDIPKGYQNIVIKKLKQKYPEYNYYFIAFLPQRDTEYKDIIHNNVNYKKHPCGIIITPDEFTNSTFSYEGQEFYLVQDVTNDPYYFNKFDILELEYLNRLQLIVNEIGEKYHPYNLPLNDKDVFALLSEGNNDNIFQFNTPSMSRILIDFKPSNIDDLSILNATYRPKLLELIPKISRNKNYDYQPEFQNSLINQLFEETYGVLVYQETFMEILKQIADFTYEDADAWRVKLFRSISRGTSHTIKEFLEIFSERIDYLSNKDQIKLKDMVEIRFKLVFPKSHSLCYSLIGYWGAFYKTHFNKEFENAFNQ